jgi:non-canonical (house-cleaning) NTP pyrophosphatase
MAPNLKDFLAQPLRGVEVCVAGTQADLLLGVRDAFRSYFDSGRSGQGIPVAVVPQQVDTRAIGLAASDEEALRQARSEARTLEEKLPGVYHFYLAHQPCVTTLQVGERLRYFLRSWTYLVGLGGESCGASGSIELPASVVEGLEFGDGLRVLPGTRRSGGTLAALTGGRESRRKAVAAATVLALSTFFYGILDLPRNR